jgi:non-heme chloroperoxidase
MSFVKTKDKVEILWDWSNVAAGPLSAKLLKDGILKTYKNFPHGMPTTEAATINADLLAFIKG